MKRINVIIADDHPLFRKGLASALADFENLHIVQEVCSGKELLSVLPNTKCDVVLLDLKMPDLDGIAATPLILERFPAVKVIVLTMLEEDNFILHLIKAGVHGYLLKNSDPEEVVDTIEKVVEQGVYFNAKISKIIHKGLLAKRPNKVALSSKIYFSQRELEVLELLCQDRSNEEIADHLCLSIRTIEGYRGKLIEKTGSKYITGMVVYAIKNKLVDF